jgi:dTDP-4-amino-4,6-dideoxygalactose transaminase
VSHAISFNGHEHEHHYRDEWLACVDDVLRATAFNPGTSEFVARLESELAVWIGRRRVVGTGSCSAALDIALEVLDLPRGSKVIVPALTFQGTAAAVVRAGLNPLFVDVEPVTLQTDPAAVAAHLDDGVSCVLLVHLYGIPAAAIEIAGIAARAGVPLIEDCAQAAGARVEDGRVAGAIGTIGAYSFGPTKPLGGLGEAGALACDEDTLADRARYLRHNGALGDFRHRYVGQNAKLDSVQAAFILRKLARAERDMGTLRALAAHYERCLAEEPRVRVVTARLGTVAAPSRLTVLLPEAARDPAADRLGRHGIATAVFYRTPLHRQPCFAEWSQVELTVTEDAVGRVLSLPLHVHMSPADVERVASLTIAAVQAVD